MNEGLRGFIHHANTQQVLQTLAQVIDNRSRIVLYGKPATGKGRLLRYLVEEYWRIECDGEKEWHPIIYANHEELDWTAEVLRGSSAPTVARTLAAIMAEIQPIAERYRPDRGIRWQQKRRSIATRTQTIWLHNELYREFKTLRVRGLLIDNAQSIDYATLHTNLTTNLQEPLPPTAGAVSPSPDGRGGQGVREMLQHRHQIGIKPSINSGNGSKKSDRLG